MLADRRSVRLHHLQTGPLISMANTPEYMANWHQSNRERRRDDKAQRRRNMRVVNPEAARAADRAEYAKRAEAKLAQKKAYYEANKEKIRQKRADHYQLNKHACDLRVRNRKQGLSVIDETQPGDWTRLLQVFGPFCMAPGCTSPDVTLDHVIPFSRGGRHHFSNFQLLCRSCNSKKGTKTIDYRTPHG
jgi:5-methylcytosine-specific restriction endonuclease McrA